VKYRAELFLRIGGLVLLAVFSYKIARPEIFLKLPRAAAPRSVLAGQLDIPRLNMSVAIVEGDDEESLSLGAGHVPGTAAIGGIGNSVIAGHRDSAFRALRKVRIGDQVLIHAAKNAAYRVTRIHTVDADDLSVLRRDDTEAKLTLITCYPFRYVGSAPRRYIVEARLSVTPSSPEQLQAELKLSPHRLRSR